MMKMHIKIGRVLNVTPRFGLSRREEKGFELISEKTVFLNEETFQRIKFATYVWRYAPRISLRAAGECCQAISRARKLD